jgi:hypothetical protein
MRGKGGAAASCAHASSKGRGHKRTSSSNGLGERASKRPSTQQAGAGASTPSADAVPSSAYKTPGLGKRRPSPNAASAQGGAAEEWEAAAAAESQQRSCGRRGGGLSERQQLQAALQLSQFCS